MPAHKSVKLNTGAEMPTVGLGTWKSQPGVVEGAVAEALKLGYKAVDTATAYGNEAEVGRGIKDSGVDRSSIFLTTKLDNVDHKDPAKALQFSLKALDTDYLDLWLMHWPAPMLDGKTPDKTIDWLDTWNEMVKLYKAHPDKLRAIGVSNFSVAFMKRLLANSDVVPAVNQVELHPACPQEDVVSFCRGKGIVNEVVKKIADKHNVHPANILISLQANRPGVTVVVKSVTPERIKSNAQIIDLSEEEIAELHEH
ncbi:NADP-dependent oxidoreductase domain-containing protein [Ephemerocybe angulata]|uniref:NADP-dependent oxidoreductase domain-containing protein n=1 Tax=Ephemerocybe angulata TaxID=980116 RepID=A0A8H6IAL6_9AGAR|nr:NADP-dependent oxidoreductase domain-containing protein [Tulosesus angulatus]